MTTRAHIASYTYHCTSPRITSHPLATTVPLCSTGMLVTLLKQVGDLLVWFSTLNIMMWIEGFRPPSDTVALLACNPRLSKQASKQASKQIIFQRSRDWTCGNGTLALVIDAYITVAAGGIYV